MNRKMNRYEQDLKLKELWEKSAGPDSYFPINCQPQVWQVMDAVLARYERQGRPLQHLKRVARLAS